MATANSTDSLAEIELHRASYDWDADDKRLKEAGFNIVRIKRHGSDNENTLIEGRLAEVELTQNALAEWVRNNHLSDLVANVGVAIAKLDPTKELNRPIKLELTQPTFDRRVHRAEYMQLADAGFTVVRALAGIDNKNAVVFGRPTEALSTPDELAAWLTKNKLDTLVASASFASEADIGVSPRASTIPGTQYRC